MASNIDVLVPVTGNPTTASVRANFTVIKTEVEALQAEVSGKQPAGTYATGTGTASGSNTGDETTTTIKTKLGITTLSGSNTGDQVIPTTLPASDVSAWAKAATKPTYTAAEVGAQPTLISGTNIRTVNGQTLLGSTDLVIAGGVASVNGLTGAVLLPPTQSLTYANRANLRSQTPTNGEQAIVDTLGLFVWESGSTEPDDDESCFATASGRWLMQAAHWDIVDELVIPEITAAAAAAAAKTLTGSATCAIVSLTSASSASFTGTVTGAAVGDRVVATPPAELGSNVNETARLTYHAWVSAPDTVTIMLTNPSAAGANTNPAIRTAWPISVIKA